MFNLKKINTTNEVVSFGPCVCCWLEFLISAYNYEDSQLYVNVLLKSKCKGR